jgi:NTP pyrophosphatase (non-canonical NTP hydrolase)
MNISELIEHQNKFDSSHGWRNEFDCKADLVRAVEKDIVGLVGELGEFSNLVKKASLISKDEDALNKYVLSNSDKISEELIDTFIYMLRLFAHFDIDVESEYFKKMNLNEKRFVGFENDS